MAIQLSLSRMFQLTAVVAVVSFLFVSLAWPIALFVVSIINAIGSIGFAIAGRRNTALLAGLTACLILAALFFTDWGLSSLHPVVHVAWVWLIAACVTETAAVMAWLLFNNSLMAAKQ